MAEDIKDSRRGERFVVVETVLGTFNEVPVILLTFSSGGVQILHSEAIRIRDQGALTFHHQGFGVAVPVIVAWSHLSQTSDGLGYKSGLKLQTPDASFTAALSKFLREGVLVPDTGSLERKRQRELEREQRRQSTPKLTIVPPGS